MWELLYSHYVSNGKIKSLSKSSESLIGVIFNKKIDCALEYKTQVIFGIQMVIFYIYPSDGVKYMFL